MRILKKVLTVTGLVIGLVDIARSQAVIDVPAETNFAEAEHAAVSARPAPSVVPHLDPQFVAAALQDPTYLPSGPTPFTFVIAHRGSHSLPGCAENSACAIAQAYASGADGVELDIKVSLDGEAVLGHDYSVARELNNWKDSQGNSVTRNDPGNLLSKAYPLADNVYLDTTKFPFLLNFKKTDGNGNIIVDSQNPTRATMNVAQFQYGQMLDTYNQLTSNHQLTLFEALYLIHQYYPMMIWLDIKSVGDLVAVEDALRTVGRQEWHDSTLATIGLKLSWSVLSDPAIAFNPAAAMGIPGIKYFLVFGTGDLDAMATYGNQPVPTSISAAQSQSVDSFTNVCIAANGCLGAELNHKDPRGPTLYMYTAIKGMPTQLASFQSIPQYSWYWQALGDQKLQSLTYDRTFPRTDGSCCFALSDALNHSYYQRAIETQDLRALYSWNEQKFTTITTDEPLLMMRELYRINKRPTTTAAVIGGTNTSVPSGGSASDNSALLADGLFRISAYSSLNGTWYLASSNNSPYGPVYAVSSSSAITPAQYWYLVGTTPNGSSPTYSLVNALTGKSLAYNSGIGLTTDVSDGAAAYQWMVSGVSGAAISPVNDSQPTDQLYFGSNYVSVGPQGNLPSAVYSWTLTSVTTPASEYAQQQASPPGYTFCADGEQGQACTFSGMADVAYGANDRFRYLHFVSGPIDCKLASFGGVDPYYGVKKACFYAPYQTGAVLSSLFSTSTPISEGSSLPAGLYAFGTVQGGYPLYTYAAFTSAATCAVRNSGTATNGFSFDPAPDKVKSCFQLNTSSPPTLPNTYVQCAREHEFCPFSGTAAVLFGSSNPANQTAKIFANGVPCERSSFGLDPALNSSKGCYYLALSPNPAQLPDIHYWSKSANETDSFVVNYGTNIAFGIPGRWVFTRASAQNSAPINGSSGTFTCNVSNFAYDPAPNTGKQCFTGDSDLSQRGPPGFSYLARDGQTATFNGTGEIAFGIDGQFVYKSFTNSVACGTAAFGGIDPYVGFGKACYYRLY